MVQIMAYYLLEAKSLMELIYNYTPGNKFQKNLYQDVTFFIQENLPENICKIHLILELHVLLFYIIHPNSLASRH